MSIRRRLGTALAADMNAQIARHMAAAAEDPDLSSVDAALLEPIHRASFQLFIDHFFVHPTDGMPAWLDDMVEQIARSRAAIGISVDAEIRGVQQATLLFWRATEDKARELGIDRDAIADLGPQMWELANTAASKLSQCYRAIDEELAEADRQRRARFLDDVLFGRLAGEELDAAAIVHNIDPDVDLVPFRARARRPADAAAVMRSLRSESCVVGLVLGELAGIALSPPSPTEHEVTIGIGPPATLRELPSSFRLASRAFDVACALGRTGTVTLADLGPAAAVVSDREVGNAAVSRYLAPLHEHPRMTDTLIETLRAYLESSLRVDATAAALFVHPNTVKYRLRRYESITGVDLSDVDEIVGLWWALRASRAT